MFHPDQFGYSGWKDFPYRNRLKDKLPKLNASIFERLANLQRQFLSEGSLKGKCRSLSFKAAEETGLELKTGYSF